MSFYRSVFAAVAAIAIASPVFADDAANPAAPAANAQAAAVQTADNSAMQPATNDNNNAQQAVASPSTTPIAINLNKASAKDLMKVKGINASKARAIVAYRKKHGEFKSVETLVKVKGFSKLKETDIKTIESQLTVE